MRSSLSPEESQTACGSKGPPNPLRPSRLHRLDHWMALHPWHPRVLPFLLYVALLPVVNYVRYELTPLAPLAYLAQCLLVTYLLWRYRRLLPEMTFTFHWLAVPVGVAVTALWIALGLAMERWFPQAMAYEPQKHYLSRMESSGLLTVALGFRLIGMSILVPVFEELFVRSLLLRSLHHFRRTGVGVLQLIHDMPVIGDWLMQTRVGMRAGRHPPVFGAQFEKIPLGALSVFGMAASTAVFMIHHVPRDWPGAIVCGLLYCLVLGYATRNGKRPAIGLGPVVWAHGITNALLWAWTVYYWDWRFL